MDATTPPPPPLPPAGFRGWLARHGHQILLLLIVGAFIALLASGGSQRAWVSEHWAAVQSWVKNNFLLAVVLYFLAYVAVTGLSIPIANVLTIGGGMVFGLWEGLAIVSFASTTGATLAMLGSRYLFRDAVRRRLGDRFETISANIAREGAFYLFTLRLMVIVPFWMINLAIGLTTMRVRTFWWVSQVGMLPGTFLYVNAAAAASQISDVRDLFTLPIVGSFALVGFAPLLLRWLVLWLRRGRPSGEPPVSPGSLP